MISSVDNTPRSELDNPRCDMDTPTTEKQRIAALKAATLKESRQRLTEYAERCE